MARCGRWRGPQFRNCARGGEDKKGSVFRRSRSIRARPTSRGARDGQPPEDLVPSARAPAEPGAAERRSRSCRKRSRRVPLGERSAKQTRRRVADARCPAVPPTSPRSARRRQGEAPRRRGGGWRAGEGRGGQGGGGGTGGPARRAGRGVEKRADRARAGPRPRTRRDAPGDASARQTKVERHGWDGAASDASVADDRGRSGRAQRSVGKQVGGQAGGAEGQEGGGGRRRAEKAGGGRWRASGEQGSSRLGPERRVRDPPWGAASRRTRTGGRRWRQRWETVVPPRVRPDLVRGVQGGGGDPRRDRARARAPRAATPGGRAGAARRGAVPVVALALLEVWA